MAQNNSLDEICQLYDSCFVAEKQNQLNKQYTASSETVYTDGTYTHTINSEGYIIINNISENTNYLMFIDQNGEPFIAIYQYTPESKYKDIMDKFTKLKQMTEMKHQSNNDEDIEVEVSDKLVDINDFKCSSCNNQMRYMRTKNNPEAIIAVCDNCQTEFVLVPSKYYVIKAKKQFYNSDNERNVNLKSNKRRNQK